MTAQELQYHGKTMTVGPVNITMSGVVEQLAHRLPVRVVLEPGDATRYDLLLAPDPADDDLLLVVRTAGRSGDIRGAAFVERDLTSYESHSGIDVLADGNPWSGEVIAWWLGHLQTAVTAHV